MLFVRTATLIAAIDPCRLRGSCRESGRTRAVRMPGRGWPGLTKRILARSFRLPHTPGPSTFGGRVAAAAANAMMSITSDAEERFLPASVDDPRATLSPPAVARPSWPRLPPAGPFLSAPPIRSDLRSWLKDVVLTEQRQIQRPSADWAALRLLTSHQR